MDPLLPLPPPLTPPPNPILILDNGSYSIKAGLAYSEEYIEPRIFPNSVARSKVDKRTYISDEIDRCKDFGGLIYRRPFEKGILTAWECEKYVWDRVFSQMKIKPTETSLLVTEPYHNVPSVAETYDQMVFEEWEFHSYYRCSPASLIPHGALFGQPPDPVPECMILIDCGYSATHIIPLQGGKVMWDLTKRIDIGGKLLTNQLKQLVSFRQWNMMDETYIINQIREECCYVSMNWRGDLESTKRNPKKNPIVQEYLLPDFSPGNTSGYILSGPNANAPTPSMGGLPLEEQILYMNNERFSVPEVLFNPADIGLKQAGIPEAVAEVIGLMPEELRGMFWAHIGLFGGIAGTDAIGERLEYELTKLCPTEFEVGLYEAVDPITPAYYGAQTLAMDANYMKSYPITRQEYLEYGSEACRVRFAAAQGLGGVVRPGDEIRLGKKINKMKRKSTTSKGKKGKRKQRYGTPDSMEDGLEGYDLNDLIILNKM